MRILVVEDDERVAGQVIETLRGAGYVVEAAGAGEEAQFMGETEDYDAVILDLGLPGVDGLTILRRWRNDGRGMPVLVLTARDTWRDKVTGLRAGADDYLAKPFELEEMLARVEALIRRSSGNANPVISCGHVQLDPATNRVTLSGSPVALTAFEYRTLSYLMHHAGRIISKTELTDHIYGQDFDRDSNVIEVLINRLRRKLGHGLIETRRGQGYRLAEPPERNAAR